MTRAATAVSRVWRTRRACRAAAPSAPRAGIRRVFALPASGALANTISVQSIMCCVIDGSQSARIGAEKIGEAQAPHHQHRAQRSSAFPAPAGGDDALTQTDRPARSLQRARQRDVFHQLDERKARRRQRRFRCARRVPWSPVQMPVSRERRFMNQAMSGNSAWRLSMAMSNRPQWHPASFQCAQYQDVGVLRQDRVEHAGTRARRRRRRRRRRSSGWRARAAQRRRDRHKVPPVR